MLLFHHYRVAELPRGRAALYERSGLLVEQALDWYGFAHRALADYLAARHVVDHELDHRLLERLGQERRREVTLIAVGLEVPAGEFRRYVEATGTSPDASGALRAPDDHPIAWVTWHEALACAAWYGASLPSEAEWEKAARGTDGRRYPWGDEWCQGVANTQEHFVGRGRWLSSFVMRLFPERSRRSPRRWTTPVGMFSPDGDSPYGCAVMAGDV
jgi:hypothetical protein